MLAIPGHRVCRIYPRNTTLKTIHQRRLHTLRPSIVHRTALSTPPRQHALVSRGPKASQPQHHRTFLTEALPSFVVPPVIFLGLLLALWGYKCFMTVVFQDKFIYLPYLPPFARSEKTATYEADCRPVRWEEKRIRSVDGTKISLCIGTMRSPKGESNADGSTGCEKEVIICYFQGNGSSLPPRLPLLSQVLKLVHARETFQTNYTIVALSYRGYWTSSGRATQSGIELDARAMLSWVTEHYDSPSQPAELILWGQSVGAGIASTAAATYVSTPTPGGGRPRIGGLVMETPFTSIKSMLLAMYPQKWLPYQYLHPFLWNHWDSGVALRKIFAAGEAPRVLLLAATRDEVVPAEEIVKLESLCMEMGLGYERRDVVGALHTEATLRREGQEAVAEFVVDVSKCRP